LQHFRELRASPIRRYFVAQIVAAYLPVLRSKPNDPTTLSQFNPLVFLQRTYPIRICFNIILQYAINVSHILSSAEVFQQKSCIWYCLARKCYK